MHIKPLFQVLLLSLGLTTTLIGGAILFVPMENLVISSLEVARSIPIDKGIEIDSSIESVIHSELFTTMSTHGDAVMAIGILLLSSAFTTKMTFSSALTFLPFFLAYGLSHILQLMIARLPLEYSFIVLPVKIAIGSIFVFALVQYVAMCKETGENRTVQQII